MKYKVTIEEFLSQDLILDVPEGKDVCQYVSEQYYKNKIVLEHGECYYRQMLVHNNECDHSGEWIEF